MGKWSHVVILTDLDGTFLSSTSGVVERNLEAIEYFKSQGGVFSLATGRMHYNLDHLIPGVNKLVNAPAILCNGTYLYDFSAERAVAEHFMAPDVSLAGVMFARHRFPRICARISRREGYLLFEDDDYSVGELKGYGIDTYEMQPESSIDPERWYKVVFTGAPNELDAMQREMQNEFPHVFEYNRSRKTTLEIQMEGTNKASLLEDFRALFAPRKQVYVCGDYENDRAILSKADVAVCPENALPEIKALCHHCLGSNDHGVIADLVEKLSKE